MRFHGVVIPCVPSYWLEMHAYLCTHWRHGRGIKRVCALRDFERRQVGLIVQGRIMLSVMLHCSVMRHQLAMRNNGGVPALVAEKLPLPFAVLTQHPFPSSYPLCEFSCALFVVVDDQMFISMSIIILH